VSALERERGVKVLARGGNEGERERQLLAVLKYENCSRNRQENVAVIFANTWRRYDLETGALASGNANPSIPLVANLHCEKRLLNSRREL